MACDGDLLRLPSVVLHLPFLPRNTVEQNVDSPSAHWSQGPSLTASSKTHQKHCSQALTCSFQQEGTARMSGRTVGFHSLGSFKGGWGSEECTLHGVLESPELP